MGHSNDIAKCLGSIALGAVLCRALVGAVAPPFDSQFLPYSTVQAEVLTALMYVSLTSAFVGTLPFFEGRSARRVLCSLSVCFLLWLVVVIVVHILGLTVQNDAICCVTMGALLAIGAIGFATVAIRRVSTRHMSIR